MNAGTTMIDWPRLLDANNIEYVESGPSTAKGNIYVHCPLCGEADQGHHMGISLKGRGWGCWRNDKHRGKDAARLLSLLLNITYGQASSIVDGESAPLLVGDDAFIEAMRKTWGPQEQDDKPEEPLMMPRYYQPLEVDRGACKMFVNYLLERGYQRYHVKQLSKMYGLHYTLKGAFKYRLIFPVYTKRGLVTWTGRTIVSAREPRYLSLPTDPEVAESLELPPAKAVIKNCLFNERELGRSEGEALLTGEGPFDAMRLDYVGRNYGVRSTGLFGKTVSDEQVATLERIGRRYKRKLFLLDPDAAMDNFAMWTKLSRIGFEAGKTPKKWEDPGAASLEQIEDFITRRVL